MAATYDTALAIFCEVLRQHGRLALVEDGCFVRDVQGKIRLLISQAQEDQHIISKAVFEQLGPYAYDLLNSIVVLHDDSEQANVGIAIPETICLNGGTQLAVKVIDRRIGGQDWLKRPQEDELLVPALVFWSLKGGVGRTTALSVLAADLARKGHNVLVLDLDLEAPGVGEQLLLDSERPKYGVLDYLVEDAIGGDVSGIANDIVGTSSLVEGAGLIHVCPAIGKVSVDNPTGYLGKLFRSYFPSGERRLSDRIKELLAQLAGKVRYDAILIDARAGINEATAAAIIGLNADVLLFGHHTPQTFAGYRLALAHLSRFIEVNDSEWRLRMKMVHAKASPLPVQQSRFRDSAYELFSTWMYDELGDFSFDVNDAEAPHYPWVILDDSKFIDFDPIENPDLLTTNLVQATFGPFISNAIERLRLTQ